LFSKKKKTDFFEGNVVFDYKGFVSLTILYISLIMLCVLIYESKMNISLGFNFSVCILRTSLCVMIRNNLYDVVSPKKKVLGYPTLSKTDKVPDFVFLNDILLGKISD